MRDRNVEFDVVKYIDSPLSEEKLRHVVELLDVESKEMLHPGSFGKLGLNIDDYGDREALIGLLVAHPEVMNRPIVVRGQRAVIARPSERVEELLD